MSTPSLWKFDNLDDPSGTKPNLVANIMTTNFGNRLCIGYQNW